MKTRYAVALAMAAGAALGAASVSGLYAQGKAPGAYAIISFSEISDRNAFKGEVVDKAPAVVKDAGGHLIVRTEKFTPLRAGDPPFPLRRYVIIAFDSVPQAQAWYVSQAMKGINASVERLTKGRAFVVEAAPE